MRLSLQASDWGISVNRVPSRWLSLIIRRKSLERRHHVTTRIMWIWVASSTWHIDAQSTRRDQRKVVVDPCEYCYTRLTVQHGFFHKYSCINDTKGMPLDDLWYDTIGVKDLTMVAGQLGRLSAHHHRPLLLWRSCGRSQNNALGISTCDTRSRSCSDT